MLPKEGPRPSASAFRREVMTHFFVEIALELLAVEVVAETAEELHQ